MVKLTVEKKQNIGDPPKNIYFYFFDYNNGEKKFLKFTEETHNAIKNYFSPIDIKEEKNIPEFDELWKLHPKGNKKTAKQRFVKVIKIIKFSELKSKLEPYIKSNDFCYLKGLDVWLNPEKEYWNDMIVKKEDKFKKEEPAKRGFFEQ